MSVADQKTDVGGLMSAMQVTFFLLRNDEYNIKSDAINIKPEANGIDDLLEIR